MTSWSSRLDPEGVAWLVCDTPNASANVLSAAVLRELAEQLTAIAAQHPVGLVISSAKSNGFIAGADIKEFVAIRTPEQGYDLVRAGQAVIQQLADLPFPSVAGAARLRAWRGIGTRPRLYLSSRKPTSLR